MIVMLASLRHPVRASSARMRPEGQPSSRNEPPGCGWRGLLVHRETLLRRGNSDSHARSQAPKAVSIV